MSEVLMIVGPPASGKSSLAKELLNDQTVYLNRDQRGGTLKGLARPMADALAAGKKVLIDNTCPTIEQRRIFIQVAQQYGIAIECLNIECLPEQAQFNAALRMIKKYGKLLELDEIKQSKDPNCFPSSVIFSFFNKFEAPTVEEGFHEVKVKRFTREHSVYTNKALFLDFDGTLRETIDGTNYPLTPDNIRILPNRTETLKKYQEQGYLLLGVSNQSGIGKGLLTTEAAQACFDRTNELLGIKIDYHFCPHNSFPVSCYCRKPQQGFAALLMEKYKLSLPDCIFVGDLTSDATFANRAGIPFVHADKFFAS